MQNVESMFKGILKEAIILKSEVHVIDREACTQSPINRIENLKYPYFLKNMKKVISHISNLRIAHYILLVDDSLEKNLLNSEFHDSPQDMVW
jgi:hypothetical protein